MTMKTVLVAPALLAANLTFAQGGANQDTTNANPNYKRVPLKTPHARLSDFLTTSLLIVNERHVKSE
jgi:hypothetical protein